MHERQRAVPESRGARGLRDRWRQRDRRLDRRALLRPAGAGGVRRHRARALEEARREDRRARVPGADLSPVRPARHSRPAVGGRGGAPAARPHPRPREQRGPRRAPHDRERDARVLGRPLRREPAPSVLRRSGGGARHGGGRRRVDRQPGLGLVARGPGRDAGLSQRQGGGRRPHASARARPRTDRKSTRLNSQSPMYLVCRLLLEKKKRAFISPLLALLVCLFLWWWSLRMKFRYGWVMLILYTTSQILVQ